jgi:hypothetical protein
MSYAASVISGSSWLSITSGGSNTNNGGIINISYVANNTGASRSGAIQVTASGASGSPITLTITQAASSISAYILGEDFDTHGALVQWAEDAAANSFVLIKATQDNTNSLPLPNNISSQPPGFPIGLFDFADPYDYFDRGSNAWVHVEPGDPLLTTDAKAEADFFYQTCKPYLTAGNLQPALDLEDFDPNNPYNGGFDSAWTSSAAGWKAMSDWVKAWIQELQLQDPALHPLIYITRNYAAHLEQYLNNY